MTAQDSVTAQDRMWQRSDDWAGAEVEDAFVMINIDSGQYVALNATASAVWDALSQPRSAAEIAEHLQQRFDVAPHECAAAVTGLLDEMQRMAMASPV